MIYHCQIDEEVICDSPVLSPPQVITVPYCDKNSSISSFSHKDERPIEESTDNFKEIIPIKTTEDVGVSTSEQSKRDLDRIDYLDKKIKKHLMKNPQELNQRIQPQEWGELSRNRGKELRIFEKILLLINWFEIILHMLGSKFLRM